MTSNNKVTVTENEATKDMKPMRGKLATVITVIFILVVIYVTKREPSGRPPEEPDLPPPSKTFDRFSEGLFRIVPPENCGWTKKDIKSLVGHGSRVRFVCKTHTIRYLVILEKDQYEINIEPGQIFQPEDEARLIHLRLLQKINVSKELAPEVIVTVLPILKKE